MEGADSKAHVPVEDLVRALIGRFKKYAAIGKIPLKHKQEDGIVVLLHKARDGRVQLWFVTNNDHEVRVNFNPHGVQGPGWLDELEVELMVGLQHAHSKRTPLILPEDVAYGGH